MTQGLNRKWTAGPGVVKAVVQLQDNRSDEAKLWV